MKSTNYKTIFIYFPSDKSDTILALSTLENLILNFTNCNIIVCIDEKLSFLLSECKNIDKVISYRENISENGLFELYKKTKEIGKCDMAFCLENSLKIKIFFSLINATQKFIYKESGKQIHKIIKYNNFINNSIKINTKTPNIPNFIGNFKTENKQKRLGLNLIDLTTNDCFIDLKQVIQLVFNFYKEFDIIFFVSYNDTNLKDNLTTKLQDMFISNYLIVDDTNLKYLTTNIEQLDLFISHNSYPLYLANIFKIETFFLFTTSCLIQFRQYNNPKELITLTSKDTCVQDIIEKYTAQIASRFIKKKKLKKEFLKEYELPKDTQLILFKANNFKQNGIEEFIDIISRIHSTNFKAVVCGDETNLKLATKFIKQYQVEHRVFLVRNFPIKTADIFLLPTHNRKFAQNILTAMIEKCVVFVPRENEVSRLLDTFALMYAPSDPNTAHKIDAILNNIDEIKSIQKLNHKLALEY